MPLTLRPATCVLILLLLPGCSLLGDNSNVERYSAALSSSETVPSATETAATGRAELSANREAGEIEYLLTLADAEHVTQAHIHLGEAAKNGPAVVMLLQLTEGVDGAGRGTARSFGSETVVARGRITDEDVTVVASQGFDGTVSSLLEAVSSGRAYVDVHTTDHPSGAIRGQVIPQIAQAQ